MKQVARRKRRIDGIVHEEIKRMATEGMGAAQISDILRSEQDLSGRLIPHIRTIQSIVRDYTYIPDLAFIDPSSWWTSVASPPGEAAYGLELLRHISQIGTLGSRLGSRLTKKEVHWYAHVRRLAPYLDLYRARIAANLYRIREQQHSDLQALDVFLAFQARTEKDDTESLSLHEDYGNLVRAGIIPNVGMDLLWMSQQDKADRRGSDSSDSSLNPRRSEV
jgi:hypothetical protein